MALTAYDLRYDPNGVGGDLVVETWISHGSRANDPSFDPQPGDRVLVGDDEESPPAHGSFAVTGTACGCNWT
jgi:hypothetical protein